MHKTHTYITVSKNSSSNKSNIREKYINKFVNYHYVKEKKKIEAYVEFAMFSQIIWRKKILYFFFTTVGFIRNCKIRTAGISL